MDYLVQMLQGVLFTAVEAVCCKMFMSTFMREKEGMGPWKIRTCVFFMVVFSMVIALALGGNVIIKSMGIIAIIIGFACVVYREKMRRKLFFSVMFYTMLLGVDVFYFIMLRDLLISQNAILVYLLCKGSLVTIIVMIKRLLKNGKGFFLFWDEGWIYYIYFPLLTIIMMLYMYTNYNVSNDSHSIMLDVLSAIVFGLVIMNVIVFYMIKQIQEKEMGIKESRQRMEYYRKEEVIYKKQKGYFHDYLKHMNYVQKTLQKGNMEKAMQYITGLVGNMHNELNVVNTNHEVIDAIVNQKYAYARSKGIHMALVLNELSGFSMKDEDIVVLLTNLWDNAIEACEKLEGNKEIIFKLTEEEMDWILYVENPTKDDLEIQDNQLATTKRDKFGHGIGMTNIMKVIDKYKGVGSFRYREGTFYFSAAIPKF